MRHNYNSIFSDKAFVLDFARKNGGRKREKKEKISERKLACHCAVLLGWKFMPFAENERRRGIKGTGKKGMGEGNGISKIEPGHFAGDNIVRLSLHFVK